MPDFTEGLIGFACGLFLMFLVALFFTTPTSIWHAEAVKRGAAEYDSRTGDWRWVEKEPQTKLEAE